MHRLATGAHCGPLKTIRPPAANSFSLFSLESIREPHAISFPMGLVSNSKRNFIFDFPLTVRLVQNKLPPMAESVMRELPPEAPARLTECTGALPKR